jgi:transglutaminase-like putative cysteine protease
VARPRSRASLLSLATLSATGAATTFAALLSWRGFSELSSRFLGPLLVLAAVLVLSGSLARWWRAPGPLVVATQVAATGVVTSLIITGSPLPVLAAWDRLLREFEAAYDSANKFAAPVPYDVPPVDPILIVGGLACMLLVDVLACTLRRIPLAGLPLLTIFSVPLGTLGHGPSWWVFTLTAAGFLAMLFVHEDEQVSRWGRSLERETGGGDAESFGVRTGAVRASAGAIGGVVTALAIVVPVLIPTMDLNVLDIGPGSGGGDIKIDNPVVDLRRDLLRGPDDNMIEIVTDDPDPSYLRIGVLNRFLDDTWSPGDRDVPSSQVSRGNMPALEGVDSAVPRESYDYQLSAAESFQSSWLPTQIHISEIDAPGDWRYDLATRDFLASDEDLDTSGLDWSFTAVKLDLDATQLALAASSAGLVSEEFTELPDGLDNIVRELAIEVTDKSASRFEKAVALQNWFRRGGGFKYDDGRTLGSGADDLVDFLRDAPGGRAGYCEQFAAAMAVMARILGIPARVAIGFLHPDQVGADTYVYSAHDLHAWPELYISGAGWVRFEPTPGGRAATVPDYTTQVPDIPNNNPTTNPTDENIQNPDRIDSETPSADARADDESEGDSTGTAFPWWQVLLVLAVVTLVVLVLVTPRALRRRRRVVRVAGGPEDAWLELRDTVRDLGLAWPRARSPRQTADVLVRWFGAPPDEFTPERPRRGPETNPVAVDALDRIVLALELARYAERDPGPAGSWAADTESCVLALTGGTTARVRRRAEWWPRSLFTREKVATTPSSDDEDAQRPAYAGVVDHVE